MYIVFSKAHVWVWTASLASESSWLWCELGANTVAGKAFEPVHAGHTV